MSQGNLNTQLLNDSNAQIMNVIGHMTGQDYVIPIYICWSYDWTRLHNTYI